MGIRVNQGYRVIEAVRIDTSLEVILAQNDTRFGTQYVTWQCKKGVDYFWGHYHTNFDAARRDLFERVLDLLPEVSGGDQRDSE